MKTCLNESESQTLCPVPLNIRLDSSRIVIIQFVAEEWILDIEEKTSMNDYCLLALGLVYGLQQILLFQYQDKGINIITSDIQFYNVLHKHLSNWKQNAWVMKNGHEVPEVEVMKRLYDLLHTIPYRCTFKKSL